MNSWFQPKKGSLGVSSGGHTPGCGPSTSRDLIPYISVLGLPTLDVTKWLTTLDS